MWILWSATHLRGSQPEIFLRIWMKNMVSHKIVGHTQEGFCQFIEASPAPLGTHWLENHIEL